MTVCIFEKTAGLSHAALELARFLSEYTNAVIARESDPSPLKAERRVALRTDTDLPAHCWSIRGDGGALDIRGGSPSAVYCGVCDALADAGIRFPADGYSALGDYRHAVSEYEAAIGEARALLPSAGKKEGILWLRLMINRCGASILHLCSMMTLEELSEICDFDHPAPVSDEAEARIREILGRSRDLAEAYLRLYGEILPDRGGEGQLASYHETTLVYIDAVAAPFTKSGAAMEKKTYDAPPMPDAEAR